jgi:hypothetical protein
MRSFKGKPCYYCGAPSVSREHAPPEQMFRGFECDSITAPSCDKHNCKKSGNDHAIVSAFLISLANHPTQYSRGGDVKKAIELAQPSFERAKRKAINRPLIVNATKAIAKLPNVAYLTASANIYNWMRMLSAVLIWDALKGRDDSIEWKKVVVESPDFMQSKGQLKEHQAYTAVQRGQDMRSRYGAFMWEVGWSATLRPYPKNLYHFSMNLNGGDVTFWHTFYRTYSWYVSIGRVKDATIEAIRQKLRSVDPSR